MAGDKYSIDICWMGEWMNEWVKKTSFYIVLLGTKGIERNANQFAAGSGWWQLGEKGVSAWVLCWVGNCAQVEVISSSSPW